MNRPNLARICSVVSIVACSLFIPLATPAGAPKPGKKNYRPTTLATDLVWPLPPEKPRFRFVREIRGASDVQALPKTTKLQRIAGVRKVVFSPTFGKPFGVATDSKHRIYVTDNGQAVVFVFDIENKVVSYIGLEGAPRLNTPMGITVDAKDRVWLADAGLRRVFAFDPALNLRAALGKPGELVNPVGVATDLTRSRLYVADSKQHCIVVYDTETGLLITKFGKRGTDPGDFAFPTDVVAGADGRIYVADAMNRRIQVFDSNYKFLEAFGSEGIAWGQFRDPKSIALDRYQNVYVLDSELSNFQIFDQKRRLLMFLGEFGNAPGQFAVPERIHIDDRNYVYVVDQMNWRVQIFELLSGVTEDPAPGAAANQQVQQ